MPIMVMKRDGTAEPFSTEKLHRWIAYATKRGAEWAVIYDKLIARIPSTVTSSELHQTMIDVCLEQENLTYSRIAARLQYAELRKNMQRHLNVTDRSSFRDIYEAYAEGDVWESTALPPYHPVFEAWYAQLYEQRFEYWQIKQHMDKYSRKIDGDAIETPHLAALGIGLAVWGNRPEAFELALTIVKGQLNLPTPVLNGCRNGDFDTISCCVISAGDTVDSIGVAEHIAYKMTAKKAGIGIELDTRSFGSPVKGGAVKHLGKQPIYATVDKAVKMFTQVSRGGSATVTYKCIDPDIESLLLLKSQRCPENLRLDKLDYSLAYCDAFVEAVQNDWDWFLFDLKQVPKAHEMLLDHKASYDDFETLGIESGAKSLKARYILKLFLQSRMETGRVYCINLSRANEHTPFIDPIHLSNLCQEICLPTKPYVGMFDLYGRTDSQGETAFCSLAAINVAKVEGVAEHMMVADIALRTVDRLIDLAPMMTPSMEYHIRKRRSVGIGITGLAGYLYKLGLDYDGSAASLKAVQYVSAAHYLGLLTTSVALVKEGADACEGVDFNWSPLDTMRNPMEVPEFIKALNELRGKPRRNSVLVAQMPTESSAVFSDATNGLYPVRQRVLNKVSRTGYVQYIAPEGNYKLAWDIPNDILARYYSIVQDFTDQAISADYYVDFSKFADGKASLSQLMREWVIQARLGNKTMYYLNTNDYTGGSIQEQLKAESEEGCESCKL